MCSFSIYKAFISSWEIKSKAAMNDIWLFNLVRHYFDMHFCLTDECVTGNETIFYKKTDIFILAFARNYRAKCILWDLMKHFNEKCSTLICFQIFWKGFSHACIWFSDIFESAMNSPSLLSTNTGYNILWNKFYEELMSYWTSNSDSINERSLN